MDYHLLRVHKGRDAEIMDPKYKADVESYDINAHYGKEKGHLFVDIPKKYVNGVLVDKIVASLYAFNETCKTGHKGKAISKSDDKIYEETQQHQHQHQRQQERKKTFEERCKEIRSTSIQKEEISNVIEMSLNENKKRRRKDGGKESKEEKIEIWIDDEYDLGNSIRVNFKIKELSKNVEKRKLSIKIEYANESYFTFPIGVVSKFLKTKKPALSDGKYDMAYKLFTEAVNWKCENELFDILKKEMNKSERYNSDINYYQNLQHQVQDDRRGSYIRDKEMMEEENNNNDDIDNDDSAENEDEDNKKSLYDESRESKSMEVDDTSDTSSLYASSALLDLRHQRIHHRRKYVKRKKQKIEKMVFSCNQDDVRVVQTLPGKESSPIIVVPYSSFDSIPRLSDKIEPISIKITLDDDPMSGNPMASLSEEQNINLKLDFTLFEEAFCGSLIFYLFTTIASFMNFLQITDLNNVNIPVSYDFPDGHSQSILLKLKRIEVLIPSTFFMIDQLQKSGMVFKKEEIDFDDRKEYKFHLIGQSSASSKLIASSSSSSSSDGSRQ